MPMMGINVTISTILQKENKRPPSILAGKAEKSRENGSSSTRTCGRCAKRVRRLRSVATERGYTVHGMRSHRGWVDGGQDLWKRFSRVKEINTHE